jgi:hypothetical protein
MQQIELALNMQPRGIKLFLFYTLRKAKSKVPRAASDLKNPTKNLMLQVNLRSRAQQYVI